MKVKALQSFAYSTDGFNNFPVKKGDIIEDFPASEYESCKGAGLIEDVQEAPAKEQKNNKDETGDDADAAGDDAAGAENAGDDEKKGDAGQDGSQDGAEESASLSQAAQAPETSQNKSGKSGKGGKSK